MEALGNDRWRGEFVRRGARPLPLHGAGLGRSLPVVAPRLRAPRRRRRPAPGRAQSAPTLIAQAAERAQRRRRRRAWRDWAQRLDVRRAPSADMATLKPLGARRRAGRSRRCAIPTGACAACIRSSCRSSSTASARASRPGTSSSRARRRREPGAHGTFATARRGCPTSRAWASTSCTSRRSTRSAASKRKGTNNTLIAGAGDVGSPWAIGAAEGGHKAILAELGTLDDFRAPGAARARARHRDRAGHRVPVRARPSVREGASGVVPLAARRQRAVRREPAQEVPGHLPVRLRDATTGRRCGASWPSVFDVLDRRRACSIFRVDNPHTKAFPFWEWAIARDQARSIPT